MISPALESRLSGRLASGSPSRLRAAAAVCFDSLLVAAAAAILVVGTLLPVGSLLRLRR